MKNKGMVVICFVMVMLMAPAFVWAAPVPDTGQTKSYKDDGTETAKKPPALCSNEDSDGNPVGCKRTYSVVGSDDKTYNRFYNDDTKEVHYFWTRRCYNEDGSRGECASRVCYDNADPSKGSLMGCPTVCYSTNKTDTRIEIPCPNNDPEAGTGDDDFYGQDANYLINSPSYSPEEGSSLLIKDDRSGLVWLIKEDQETDHNDSKPNNLNNTYTWADTTGAGGFLVRLNAFGYEDYDDWRIPTAKELASIVNCDSSEPAVDSKGSFSDINPGEYWTATSGTGDQAYYVDFSDGSIKLADDVTVEKYVIAVRGSTSTNADFVVNDDDTITDKVTGLMWRKTSHNNEDWEGALLSCEALVSEGFDDWRLPSRAELLSIVDYTKDPVESALIGSTFSVEKDLYWTSTSYVKAVTDDPAGRAWAINFADGTLVGVKKDDTSPYVLAVRGGQNEQGASFIVSLPQQTSEWKIGRILPIVWSKASAGATISISRDGGKNFDDIDGTWPLGDNSMIWTVTGPASDSCLLKITPTSGNPVTQGLFSIEEGTGDGTTGTPGDLTDDNLFNLADIIRGLQILTGQE